MKSRHHLWRSWHSPGKNMINMISTYHAINCNYVIITLHENKNYFAGETQHSKSKPHYVFIHSLISWPTLGHLWMSMKGECAQKSQPGLVQTDRGTSRWATCVQWTQATESGQAPPTPWRQFSGSCGGKLVLLKHCQLAAADKQAPSQSSTHSAVSGTILEHVGEMAAYHFSNVSADIPSSLTGHFWYRVPCIRTPSTARITPFVLGLVINGYFLLQPSYSSPFSFIFKACKTRLRLQQWGDGTSGPNLDAVLGMGLWPEQVQQLGCGHIFWFCFFSFKVLVLTGNKSECDYEYEPVL